VSASGGGADCDAAGVIIIVEASNYGSKSGLECSHNTQPRREQINSDSDNNCNKSIKSGARCEIGKGNNGCCSRL
jgi:hypothetical protein